MSKCDNFIALYVLIFFSLLFLSCSSGSFADAPVPTLIPVVNSSGSVESLVMYQDLKANQIVFAGVGMSPNYLKVIPVKQFGVVREYFITEASLSGKLAQDMKGVIKNSGSLKVITNGATGYLAGEAGETLAFSRVGGALEQNAIKVGARTGGLAFAEGLSIGFLAMAFLDGLKEADEAYKRRMESEKACFFHVLESDIWKKLYPPGAYRFLIQSTCMSDHGYMYEGCNYASLHKYKHEMRTEELVKEICQSGAFGGCAVKCINIMNKVEKMFIRSISNGYDDKFPEFVMVGGYY